MCSYFSKSSVLHWITMTSSFTCTAASFLVETRHSIAWNRWRNKPRYRVTQFYFRSWTSTLFSCTLENSRWAISFWWTTNRVTYGVMSRPFKFPITNFFTGDAGIRFRRGHWAHWNVKNVYSSWSAKYLCQAIIEITTFILVKYWISMLLGRCCRVFYINMVILRFYPHISMIELRCMSS